MQALQRRISQNEGHPKSSWKDKGTGTTASFGGTAALHKASIPREANTKNRRGRKLCHPRNVARNLPMFIPSTSFFFSSRLERNASTEKKSRRRQWRQHRQDGRVVAPSISMELIRNVLWQRHLDVGVSSPVAPHVCFRSVVSHCRNLFMAGFGTNKRSLDVEPDVRTARSKSRSPVMDKRTQ